MPLLQDDCVKFFLIRVDWRGLADGLSFSRFTFSGHYIKKPLINQQHRANIRDKPMNQRTYLLLLLLIIVCLSIPLAVNAQVTALVIIEGDGQTGRPGQTLEPFIVEARDQNDNIVIGELVGFLQDSGSLSSILATTGSDGRAQTTLTLPRRPGTTTVRAWVGNFSSPDASATFTARAITAPPPPTIPTGPLPPSPPIQTKLVRISGDDQEGLPGKPLANPFVVQVLDEDGDPFEGATVKFSVLLGGGSLSAATPTTDADGQAESILTLGTTLGTNKVQVNVEGISQVLVFSAEATTTPSVVTVLSIISGDNQTGVTGEALANPFVVEARDGNGTPLEGVGVTFAVSTGGGSLSDTSVETNTDGVAQSILTLGSDPGTNTVEVSVEGIAKTEIFNAEATLPPPTPTTLSVVSGQNQEGLTSEMLADPFVVQVHDQYGNPISGVPVTFTVLGDDDMLTATTVTTDANGQATNTLTLGNDSGTVTVEVGVEGIAETATFNAVAKLLQFDLSLPAGLNLIHLPLKVRAVDGTAQTIESVSDLYDALGGADTVHWLATYDPATQEWHGYFRSADRGTTADSALTDQTGILASIKAPISVRLGGDAFGEDGGSTIALNQGLNLVGLPLNDPRITRVSDVFALEGVGGNIAVIIVTDNSEFKLVGRAGDPGDIEITGGQSFILIVQEGGIASIIGGGWDNSSINSP